MFIRPLSEDECGITNNIHYLKVHKVGMYTCGIAALNSETLCRCIR